MRIDSVYYGPFKPPVLTQLDGRDGGYQTDKRMRLSKSLENINQKVDSSLKTSKKNAGLNTSRDARKT